MSNYRTAYDAIVTRFGAPANARELEELLDELVASVTNTVSTAKIEALRNELDAKKDLHKLPPGPALFYVLSNGDGRAVVDQVDWSRTTDFFTPRELAILGALLRFTLEQLPKGGSGE